MGLQVGPADGGRDRTRGRHPDAGVRNNHKATLQDGKANGRRRISIGQYEVRPIDQAAG